MMGLLGFFLISVAMVFFVVFLMGENLNTKEKINLALSIIVFLAVLIIGAYLITEYSGI